MGDARLAPQDTCARAMCGNSLEEQRYTPSRRDSIVYGEHFCSELCQYQESNVRKQKRRRDLKLDHATRRARDLRKKYGITVDDWERMYDAQLGRCSICLIPLAEVKACVDHDHGTGAVRGILCETCNVGIGMLKDEADNMLRAYHYLSNATCEVQSGEEVIAS